MSDRRFVIQELLPDNHVGRNETDLFAITESELKHRIAVIIGKDEEIPGLDLGWAIPIILHGEKEPCYICHSVDGHEPFCSRGIGEGKEPPPDVWESWLQRMPDQYDYPYWTDWAKAIQQWFMEIPCRRKP
jgi:hypothetical protein